MMKRTPRAGLMGLVLVYLLVSCLTNLAYASYACEEAFKADPLPSVQEVHQFRKTQIRPASGVLTVNGHAFALIGVLGQSAATVYVAKSPEGRLVTIKSYPLTVDQLPAHLQEHYNDAQLRNTRPGMAYHEIAATEFAQEAGVAVPKILDVELQDGAILIVKEYVEGITGGELQNNKANLEFEARLALTDSLGEAEFRLKNKVFQTHFRPWLEQNRPRLLAKYPVLNGLQAIMDQTPGKNWMVDYLSKNGDVKAENLLWSPLHRKWILFDP